MFGQTTQLQIVILTVVSIISLFAAEFEKPKIGISGKGLKVHLNMHICFLLEQ